jgi:hypothetical protein
MILTVVDRFSKVAHLIPLAHLYSATTVAHTFFDSIVRLHDIPTTSSATGTRCSPATSRHTSSRPSASSRTCCRCSTRSQMSRQRQSTRSSSCTCVVSSVTGHDNGYSGLPGRSTATILPSRHPFAPHNSTWCMVVTLRCCTLTQTVTFSYRWSCRNSATGMNSSWSSAVGLSKHNNTTRQRMIASMGTWSSRRANGCCYDCCTIRQCPWISQGVASSVPASIGHSRSWSVWVVSHTSYSCRWVLVSTMFSISVSSTDSPVSLLVRQGHCLLYVMVTPVSGWRPSSRAELPGATSNCWCIGQIGQQQRQAGLMLKTYASSTLNFSLRTSCW